MSSLRAWQFLSIVAQSYQKDRQNFSRQEIVKKINEIKYLSSQKKVPKLSLRKEIVHLETQLSGILDLEKGLLASQKKESAKQAALKKQIAVLKQKLAANQDKDLQKKVDKVSHLLAECLAKKEIGKDVALQGSVVRERKVESPEQRMQAVLMRLQRLKRTLAAQSGNPKVKELQSKIEMIEAKMQGPTDVRHRMIMHHGIDVALEKELPLPPPPKA
jgi:hypothetical protein